jgi:ATP-binding cassette, subfamily B, bacterial
MSTVQKTLKIYWSAAWKYPKHVWGLIIMVPITLLFHQFLPPLIAANILDKLSTGDYVPNKLWESFGTELLLYAVITLFGGIVLWRVVVFIIWHLEAHVTRDLARMMFDHFMNLSAGFHANSFGGSLVSQTNKFVGAYIRIADTTIFQMYTMIMAFVFTIVILVPRVPWYVAGLVIFSGIFMATAIRATHYVRELSAQEAAAQNKTTAQLADSITNVMAVKSFASGNSERKRFAIVTDASKRATLHVMKASLKREAYFASVTTGLQALALVGATASVVLFRADIGTVFLVLTYTANISTRLWEFSQQVIRNYNRSLGDAREATITLGIQPSITDPSKPEKSRMYTGAVKFNAVTFAHEESEFPLFKDLNIEIQPGEKVGMVGHSGSGKTSLTKLLLRYADISDGAITIDGQDIRSITQDDLRKAIAYVPQEPLLFHRSIRENIAYGKPPASDEEIVDAAKKANAHEFIETLPKGYDTLVGERGVKLSGGQRQRVAIARALIKDAPILVLDEATSALDSESEKLIQAALWQLMSGRTAIVIAHRLSTVQKMDRIIVLDNGRIVEQGSHSEMLSKNGRYAKLWAHQSGGFITE